MRILVSTPGHIRTAPMGFYCAETFRSLGHEVLLFDAGSLTLKEKLLLRPVAKIRGQNRIEKVFLNRRLSDTARNFRPDFFLSIFGCQNKLEDKNIPANKRKNSPAGRPADSWPPHFFFSWHPKFKRFKILVWRLQNEAFPFLGDSSHSPGPSDIPQ